MKGAGGDRRDVTQQKWWTMLNVWAKTWRFEAWIRSPGFPLQHACIFFQMHAPSLTVQHWNKIQSTPQTTTHKRTAWFNLADSSYTHNTVYTNMHLYQPVFVCCPLVENTTYWLKWTMTDAKRNTGSCVAVRPKATASCSLPTHDRSDRVSICSVSSVCQSCFYIMLLGLCTL